MPTSIPPSKREETEPDERVVDEIYRHELLRRLPRVESSVVITVTHEPWRKTLKKTPLKLVAPATENRTVTPRRRPNAAYRTREHLTATEVEKLIKAAGNNRWGHRDATMILVAYRHGLRVSELVDLRWDQIDFDHARLHVRGNRVPRQPIRFSATKCGL